MRPPRALTVVAHVDFTYWIAILKAIAQKLIPGTPIPARISILQQTSDNGSDTGVGDVQLTHEPTTATSQASVLEDVIDQASSRNNTQEEIDSEFLGISVELID